MNVENIVADISKTLGRRHAVTGIRPRWVFKDGIRTAEIRGYAYECVALDHGYMRFSVGIDGPRQLDDAAVAANAIVTLVDPAIKVYFADGAHHVSVTAAGIRPAKTDAN